MRTLLFPIGLASAALTGFKKNDLTQHLQKIKLVLPFLILNKVNPIHCSKDMLSIGEKIIRNRPSGIVKFITYSLRFFHLFLIFLPSILLLPFAIFKKTQNVWIRSFVWSISKAGVVWIKVFQHMSHRGDVIGEDLAESFEILRSFSPEHSYQQTQQIFRRLYQQSPQVFFDYINRSPIASGSISQVYEAIFRGQKVAVKVRHPNIERNIQKDISIVFAASKFLTFFTQFFQIPINQDSFRDKLLQQLDFKKQKQNLTKFNHIFMNPEVAFPEPFYESNQQVLIMTFMPGQTMTEFEKHYDKKLRKYVARIGASAFFQMLFQHNFIHVDCHGGNIMVKINKQYSIWTELRDYFRIIRGVLWSQLVYQLMNTKYLKFLVSQHNKEFINLKFMMMGERAGVQVSIIDVGMVIQLEDYKRKYFLNLLSQVIEANPKKCAQMIYGISTFGGKTLKEGQFAKYLQDLQDMFKIVQGKDLKDIKGLEMLRGMLRVIRKHRMKLDGEFATLLTNMLALQGIAKKLDPDINIMRCAVPYLPFRYTQPKH